MGRITIKGGTWKNTEDEILKVAVMKYGKNQWSRISSLLIRKSAKQCKARWYEWLDPSIRKTEWSREEEEKLLHLAKIMPCQWRTIAPMLGRTAAQCLEHYEQLLDAAQQPETVAASAAAAASSASSSAIPGAAKSLKSRLDDPRHLRPGEIDPLPESKPARPDPHDMDEDEKEMLSEARARVANTKGKKAKRKAREKQLEEARRLTVLQRQRELKAAGIEVKSKKRKVGIDYMEEIPFEKQAPAGFYGVEGEDEEAAANRQNKGFRPVNLEDLEGKSRVATEMEERKKDAKKMKLFKETALPDALLKINQINDPQQISRRMNMSLPSPTVSDRELQEIAKLGGGNLVAAINGGGATPMLRHQPGAATPMRTPARTPLRPDTIMRESQNLLTITQTQSSLLGGENAPMHDSDFTGATPKRSVVQTPNYLATPQTAAGGKTPRSHVPGTPMRDALGTNSSEPGARSLTANQAIAASRARTEGRRTGSKLASSLSSLPAPVNQFALVLPDIPMEDVAMKSMEEDAEDAAARVHASITAQREADWRAESQVIQRGLPRPLQINTPYPTQDEIEAAIEQEMYQMMKYDAAKHSIEQPNAKRQKRSKLPALTHFSAKELDHARTLIDVELTAQGKLTKDEVKQFIQQLDLSEWDAHTRDTIFLPSTKSFGLISETSESDLLAAYKQQFELTKSNVQAQSKRASKLESNVGVLVGGYQAINTKLKTECAQIFTQLSESLRDQSCFQLLANMEEQAIPKRKAELQQLYLEQQELEKSLQRKYQLLSQQAAEMAAK